MYTGVVASATGWPSRGLGRGQLRADPVPPAPNTCNATMQLTRETKTDREENQYPLTQRTPPCILGGTRH